MVSMDAFASAFGFDAKSDDVWTTLGKVTAVNGTKLSVLLGGSATPMECEAYYLGAKVGDIVFVAISKGVARAIGARANGIAGNADFKYVGVNNRLFVNSLSGDNNGELYFHSANRNQPFLMLHGATDGYGDAVVMGDGGMVVVGSGESPQNWYDRILGTSDDYCKNKTPGSEELHLTSDGWIYFVTNAQTVESRKIATVNNSGSFHTIDSDIDNSLADNNLSATRYNSWGWLDKNNRYMGFIQNVAFASGATRMELFARNFGTGANVDNGLRLTVENDGTRKVGVSDAGAWRDALGVGNWGQFNGQSSSLSLTTSRQKVPLTGFSGQGCTASSNGVKVPAAGYYEVSGAAYMSTGFTAGNLIHLEILKGSTLVADCLRHADTANPYETWHVGPIIVSCAANDVIYLYAYNQNTATGTVQSRTGCGLMVKQIG